MRGVLSVVLIVVVALMMVTAEAGGGKKRKEHQARGKGAKATSDCTEWTYGNCVPNNGDCGLGVREGTCNNQTKKLECRTCGEQIKKLKCKVPCNWKKEFGADCKYKFGSWGECDMNTGLKTRSGTLKKALYNAQCQTTRSVTKPCPKTKTKAKGKKGKGKEH